ncbi:MAG TPA: response regulator [Allosphingosinicella sp.]|jgi:signal transduction histidine kinase/CheY-like chemotaxis protein|nr:response regulator [Allosphingosinicella sp.]
MNPVAATQPIRARKWLSYPIAVLLCFLALWVRLELGGLFVHSPFLLFMIAVALSAFLGGVGPGLLAAVVSGILADYYLLAPAGSLGLVWPQGWVAMGIYFAVAATVITLINGVLRAYEIRRESEQRLLDLNAALEARVAERTRALEAEAAERREAEAQIRQMQKMESIGQLTGGIAHDFNNMLAIVTGSLDMAKRRLTGQEHPKVVACIDNAAEGARRAAVLTARLLAFSRQQPLEPQALDANKLVAGMSELLRRTIGEHIHVETVLGGGLWPTFADPAQLENALINLAVNARDAMAGGGKLTIETANTHLDDLYAQQNAEVRPGRYVMISVSDTGTGMAPDVIERAFDPFFTTKKVGEGTGLGLSQVFGYVRQSGGHVKIYSEPRQGTAIKLYLPRHLGAAAARAEERFPAAAMPMGAPEHIVLVVEDEEQVRAMTVDALRELGYTVVEAANGERALERLAEMPRVDLLFTDIVMPGMNGRELADKVRAERPGTQILFTTGYTRNAVVHNGMLDAGVAFLAKPFTIDQLARKVAEVLAGAGANRV